MWTTPDAPARYQRGLKFGLNAGYIQVFRNCDNRCRVRSECHSSSATSAVVLRTRHFATIGRPAYGKRQLCSACDPNIAKWHGQFHRESAAEWISDKHGLLCSKREVENWLGRALIQ
jgi:hypothetical protein